jgi:hypothetical protein
MRELGELVGHYATQLGLHAAAAYQSNDAWHIMVARLLQAQNEFACMLNEADQGSRHGFHDFNEWANRLAHLKAMRDQKEGAAP